MRLGELMSSKTFSWQFTRPHALVIELNSLTFQTQFQYGPCAYPEKVFVRCMSLKTREGSPQFWKHRYTNIRIQPYYIFQPTRLARECYAVGHGPNKSTRRRIGVTTKSPTKGAVEVVQLKYYYHPINWKYPFLTGPEKEIKPDSCHDMNMYVLQRLNYVCVI